MSSPLIVAGTGPTCKCAAWLDWMQMLSGAVLILFMWCHLFLVSSVVLSPNLMNAIANFFEATYMAQLGGPVIAAIFLLHFVLAARKIPFRSAEQGVLKAHLKQFDHLDTKLWVVQAVTALIVLVMGSVHLWVVLSDLPITAAKSAARVQKPLWLLFYLVLLPMIELHVGLGFYRIGVKWGFISAKRRPFFKKRENQLTILFIVIGLITLVRFSFLAVPK